jgi:eukaryotic-like serine/threonine-protein kinase
VLTRIDPKTRLDIWVLPMMENAAGERKAVPFLQTEFNESQGQLSPDSRWMAYTSDESGQREVYVRPFPSGEGKWKISTAGGEQARWRGDGKELFYVVPDGKMNAVALRAAPGSKPALDPGVPAPQFDPHIYGSAAGNQDVFQYDVTADGKRFLVITPGGGSGSSPPLTVVLNWQAGLRK